ncbi:Uncharacterised protein [Mycobacteroides abscessus subsp. abscessus]|nr:Uncharacterised protein [Mycobacteroides abscessus subsp. abscessus]
MAAGSMLATLASASSMMRSARVRSTASLEEK